MALITIQDRQVEVDIAHELEQYEWSNANWSDNKLIASSPFRSEDRHPSFYIDLEGEYAAVFGDSAAEDDRYSSGTLPTLLAYLRNETYEESCEYLLEKYDVDYSTSDIELRMSATIPQDRRYSPIPSEVYDKPVEYEYMRSRGIHPKVTEMNGIFDAGKTVGIPWRDVNGDVMAIKYRSKTSKIFFYETGGMPLKNLVYGLDIVVERGITRAVIVESEIDAMTWQSAGIFAIALGGARMNAKQADMILSAGITEVVLGGDNDEAGRNFNRKVESLLENKVDIYELDYREFNGMKDSNELGASRLRKLAMRRKSLLSEVMIL